ncbi:protein TIC110 [Pyrus ussuriensis x Pyrus communis]|uniref:Protein TIC110 n=1 Tax=Pyrus ussuriensis x Pyrus communis TaxID=2448454 RepID=A0A5N5HDB2_9ROSA|nr:protein TIC110 [Pyrus ussuriensis x Pyrus communis]
MNPSTLTSQRLVAVPQPHLSPCCNLPRCREAVAASLDSDLDNCVPRSCGCWVRVGSPVGEIPKRSVCGAAVLKAADGAVVYALNSCTPEVTVVDLHIYVAGLDDPKVVKKEDIEGIGGK